MKDKRPGQELWIEWHGKGFYPEITDAVIYYTVEHVDIENEVVKRALASTLQRDGVCDGLNEGFKAIDKGIVSSSWAGVFEEDFELHICDELGETEYGDILEDIDPITLVEINNNY